MSRVGALAVQQRTEGYSTDTAQLQQCTDTARETAHGAAHIPLDTAITAITASRDAKEQRDIQPEEELQH